MTAVAAGFAAAPTESLPPVLGLSEAVEIALARNPELRVGAAEVESATGRAIQARQWKNPELELAAEDLPVRDGGLRESKTVIGLAQEVPWPGKKPLEGAIGKAGIRQAQAELQLRRVEVIRDVKAAFFRVLAAERLVEAARELAQVAEASSAAAGKRVQAGAAPDQEQLRAEIQHQQALAEVTGYEQELAGARADLAAILGRPDLQSVRLGGELVENPDRLSVESPPAGEDAAPALAAAQLARERAALEWRRARLEPYPDVRVGLDGGREGREDNAIVQFRVSVPLPLLDRSQGRQREARANLEAAEARIQQVKLRRERDWAEARRRFRAAAGQVSAYRDRILPRAEEALRLVRIGFEEGKFSFVDLSDTQRTAAETRIAYLQKLLEMNLAHAQLEALAYP